MKKLVMAALVMAAFVSTGIAQGVEGNPLKFDATLDLYSAYIWRGMELNDEPVAQPGATISYDLNDDMGTIAAGVWANYDFTNHRSRDGRADGFSRVDYALSYAIDVSDVSLEIGNLWYTRPNRYGASGDTQYEVFGSAAYNNDIVVPAVTVYYDYYKSDGIYANFSLNKEVEVTEQVTAGVFGSVGVADSSYTEYNSYGYVDNSAFVDSNLGAYTSYAINDNFSVGATLVWTSLLDGDARDAADVAHMDKSNIWGGINLAASF